MSSVWYIGSGERRISASDWAQVLGAGGWTETDWNANNYWSIPTSALSSDQLAFLATQPDFALNQPDGPRNIVGMLPIVPFIPATNKNDSKLVAIGDLGLATSNNLGSTANAGSYQVKIRIGIPATNLQPVFQHWYTPVSTFFDTDPVGPITFSADIRILSSSNPNATLNTPYRMTLGGRITTTLDPGGEITADPIGITVLPGDVVAVRTYLSSGTAWAIRPATFYSTDTTYTATTDLTMSASALGSGVGNIFPFGPSQLLGRVEKGSTAPAFYFIGDSILSGYGDQATSYRPDIGLGGWQIRALQGKAGIVNAAVPGDRATTFRQSAGALRRLRSAQRTNVAVINYGANDFGIYSITAAQLEVLNLAIAMDVRKAGVSKVYLTTLLPRTTSTDGWLTTTNQTPFSSEPQRVAYNTWVRAGCPVDSVSLAPVAVGTNGALFAGSSGHPITGFIDICAPVESSKDSGLWAATGRQINGTTTANGITLAITSGTLNTVGNVDTGGDVGQGAFITGAGAAGAGLQARIATVPTSTSATVDVLTPTAVTGTPIIIGGSTNDGTHPSSKGHIAIAALLNPVALAA